MKKFFTEHKRAADVCLIAFLLLLALALYLALAAGEEQGAWAVVRLNGEEVARYSLGEDGSYELNGGTNILVIEDGEAYLSDADCPDRLCVKQGHIHFSGQCITCLPNKLTVTIEGGENNGIDLVS